MGRRGIPPPDGSGVGAYRRTIRILSAEEPAGRLRRPQEQTPRGHGRVRRIGEDPIDPHAEELQELLRRLLAVGRVHVHIADFDRRASRQRSDALAPTARVTLFRWNEHEIRPRPAFEHRGGELRIRQGGSFDQVGAELRGKRLHRLERRTQVIRIGSARPVLVA